MDTERKQSTREQTRLQQQVERDIRRMEGLEEKEGLREVDVQEQQAYVAEMASKWVEAREAQTQAKKEVFQWKVRLTSEILRLNAMLERIAAVPREGGQEDAAVPRA